MLGQKSFSAKSSSAGPAAPWIRAVSPAPVQLEKLGEQTLSEGEVGRVNEKSEHQDNTAVFSSHLSKTTLVLVRKKKLYRYLEVINSRVHLGFIVHFLNKVVTETVHHTVYYVTLIPSLSLC